MKLNVNKANMERVFRHPSVFWNRPVTEVQFPRSCEAAWPPRREEMDTKHHLQCGTIDFPFGLHKDGFLLVPCDRKIPQTHIAMGTHNLHF